MKSGYRDKYYSIIGKTCVTLLRLKNNTNNFDYNYKSDTQYKGKIV